MVDIASASGTNDHSQCFGSDLCDQILRKLARTGKKDFKLSDFWNSWLYYLGFISLPTKIRTKINHFPSAQRGSDFRSLCIGVFFRSHSTF